MQLIILQFSRLSYIALYTLKPISQRKNSQIDNNILSVCTMVWMPFSFQQRAYKPRLSYSWLGRLFTNIFTIKTCVHLFNPGQSVAVFAPVWATQPNKHWTCPLLRCKYVCGICLILEKESFGNIWLPFVYLHT